MPYAIDFDDIEQKLFLLEQLAYASERFCASKQISRKAAELASKREEFKRYASLISDWQHYAFHLESQVGNIVIECATKTRVVQDIIQRHDQIDIFDLDREASSGLKIGTFADGSSLSGVRQSCNKIIHATEATLKWNHKGDVSENGFEYWDGTYLLSGKHHGEEWKLSLLTDEWCTAMSLFHTLLEERVDWHRVWNA